VLEGGGREGRAFAKENMGDQAQFEVLMGALTSQNNEERKAAETQFEALIRNPAQAAPLMCTAMAASADLTVRSMTTIMFRKRVDRAFYDALTPDVQVFLPRVRCLKQSTLHTSFATPLPPLRLPLRSRRTAKS